MKNLKTYFLALTVLIAFSAYSQDFTANTSSSTVKWTGEKVTGTHYGHIKIKEGTLKVKKNTIESGMFAIDMTTISCDDLEGEWHDKLIGHLKSEDFFGVDKHPVSTLKITSPASFKNGEAEVKANLTIKDKTHPVTFKAKKDGSSYTATIVVDRTLYDIRYGSGKFFDNLGDKTISDEFTLEVKLVAM